MMTGRMESYHIGEEQVILAGPQLDFWRAVTDNDRASFKIWNAKTIQLWKGAHIGVAKQILINKEKTNPNEFNRMPKMEKVEFSVEYDLPLVGATAQLSYVIYPTGSIDVTIAYTPGKKEGVYHVMPRFGSRLELAPGFDFMTWFGRGPEHTYLDQKDERLGIFSTTVAEDWEEYSRPQENGNKEDVRWITFTDKNGRGIRVTADSVISTTATHYTRDDMERSRYTWQMEARSSVFVNLDYRQMGVGGITSWSPRAMPEPGFRVKNEPMTYTYRIEPIIPASTKTEQ
jgi:beta-galactosidase